MSESIYSEVLIIKWLLVAIIFLFMILVKSTFNFAKTNIEKVKSQIAINEKRSFFDTATKYSSVGDFDLLLSLANERYSNYPYDLDALWFISIAHFRKSNFSEALSSFRHIQQIDPVWKSHEVNLS